MIVNTWSNLILTVFNHSVRLEYIKSVKGLVITRYDCESEV